MTKAQTNVQASAGKAKKADAYDFQKVAASYSTAQVMAYADKVKAAFDDRSRFELTRSATPAAGKPILEKLSKRQAAMSQPNIVRAMMALGVDPNFINGTKSKDGNGSRFNVYAIDKAIKLAGYMMLADKIPGVLKACLKSMVNFKEAGEVFTREFAEAAVCDKIRLENSAGAKLLMRHTVDKNTASTQTSSNMRVLEAFGLIVSKGSNRSATYEFADTDQAKSLQQLVAA